MQAGRLFPMRAQWDCQANPVNAVPPDKMAAMRLSQRWPEGGLAGQAEQIDPYLGGADLAKRADAA